MAATHWYPEASSRILSRLTQDAVGLGAAKAAVTAVLVGLLYRAHKHLERLALNNFVADDTWDWSREVVLVTGGSSGIGAAIVNDFSARGITVVNLDISPPPPQTSAPASTSKSKTKSKSPPSPSPSKVHFYELDVCSTSAIEAVADKIRAEVGVPSVVINNAGVGGGQLVLDESDATLERTVGINLTAHFRMAKAFLPDMIAANHGHVVTVASMASFVAMPSSASYAASKAGVLAFHEALAGELAWRYRAPKVRLT